MGPQPLKPLQYRFFLVLVLERSPLIGASFCLAVQTAGGRSVYTQELERWVGHRWRLNYFTAIQWGLALVMMSRPGWR